MKLKMRLMITVLAATAAAAYAEEAPVLSLSLNDAVERALKNNVDIAVQRFAPEGAAQAVRQARGVYDPLLTSTVQRNSTTSASRSSYEVAPKIDSTQADYNFGVSQYLPTGAQIGVSFDNSRTTSNSVLQAYSPQFASALQGNITQPLLRDLRIDNQRYQLKVAKVNREISDVQFRQTVITTVAAVKEGYYDLIYSIDNLDAQRKSLALAQKLLEENRIKVKVGTMAPLDVVQAESEVASREADVIVAEAAVSQAEDNLKSQIFPRNEAETWALRIVPSDRPTAEARQIDVDAAIRTALEQRTDMRAANKNVEIADLGLALAKNNFLPGLDLTASYGTNGTGGRRVLRDLQTGQIIGYEPGGYSDATGQVFRREFPSWSIGAQISYPIFNRAAAGARGRARVTREQALASVRRLELQVAAEVRAAARAVETNFKRVDSTGAARVLAAKSLDAEDKKFAAGMSTNYLVTQKQRDLALAEVLELRAIADYRKSLIEFDRVQEAGGGLISFASSGSASSGSGN